MVYMETTTPALSSYDYILVNSSAGKDSQAMLDLVAEMAKAEGISDRVIVVHADLGRVEWEGTKELAAEQAAHYGFRFEVVSRELGDLLDQVEQRHASNQAKGKDHAPWPSSEARWCTSDQKTSQVLKFMTRLVQEASLGRQVRILNCLGIRAQESPARAKKASFELDKKATNGLRHVDRWLPIFTWTAKQVWARIRESGVRHHEAYDLGMSRLSCCFCVMASYADLVIATRANPALATEYQAVEERTGYTMVNGRSMADLISAASTPVAGPVARYEDAEDDSTTCAA
jgi:3'-phosphoadenosine 5'-phosphosulfate sulfotransferase (PAPS reductase)/FAD synthetase